MIIKICGITRCSDAQAVIDAGADMLGLMFVKRSGRYVEAEIAREISLFAANQVKRVGVFADHSVQQIEAILRIVPLDNLQFNGNESEFFCQQFALPYFKAAYIDRDADWSGIERDHKSADCLMLDNLGGGTGEIFDWDLWPVDCKRPLMLAGGLTPENVGAAVDRLRPAGVDVSSGVEGGVKGMKMARKIEQFVDEVRRVEATL